MGGLSTRVFPESKQAAGDPQARGDPVHCLFAAGACLGQQKPRARDLGIPFEGTPGTFNAITDVKGVEVGYTTLIAGDGKLVAGKGPVRTGVTAVLPQGKQARGRVFA